MPGPSQSSRPPQLRIESRAGVSTQEKRTSTTNSDDDSLDLLIVGGGPVGMTAALEARRLGLSVRIVERKAERSKHDSRAVVVHPRVMELLEPLRGGKVVDEIARASFQIEGVFLYFEKWFRGGWFRRFFLYFEKWFGDGWFRRWFQRPEKDDGDGGLAYESFDRPLLDMTAVRWGDTEHPRLYFLPQYETERILEEALAKEGLAIDYGRALEDLEQGDGSVTATLRREGGGRDGAGEGDDGSAAETETETKTVKCRWLLGCDGGRSKTRDLVGVHLDRHSLGLHFVIADVSFRGEPPLAPHGPGGAGKGKGAHVFPSTKGTVALFPLPGENAYRLAAVAPDGMTSKDSAVLDEAFCRKLLRERTGMEFDVALGPWRNVFEVTHGSSDAYVRGNVALAGDASHVHSPIGGQGMNLGMQDAHNALWKLAWAKRILDAGGGEGGSESDDAAARRADAAASVLGSYHSERRALGEDLVRTVETATRFMFSSRSAIVGLAREAALRSAAALRLYEGGFRRAGQLEVAYDPESSPFVLPAPGGDVGRFACRPGGRLPNLVLDDEDDSNDDGGGRRLHGKIDRARHTWVVLNPAEPPPSGWSDRPCVHATPARDQASVPVVSGRALSRPQAILVRPDLFVAAVGDSLEELEAAVRDAFGEECYAAM